MKLLSVLWLVCIINGAILCMYTKRLFQLEDFGSPAYGNDLLWWIERQDRTQ